MVRVQSGPVLALMAASLLLASCGQTPLGRAAASASGAAQAQRAKSWPPANPTATVETISGGHDESSAGFVVNVPAAEARYRLPNGITFADHTLYVSHARNNVITAISREARGLFAREFAGDPMASGDQDGVGRDARFTDPQDLATMPDGSLALVEYHGHSVRALKPTAAGGVATTVVPPSDEPVILGPYGVAAGKSGAIYVSDLDKKRVVKITRGRRGEPIQTVLYQAEYEDDPVPLCLTVDDQENVYFGSYYTIYKMTSTGADLQVASEKLPKLAWDLAYANGHLAVAACTYVLDVDLATKKFVKLAGDGNQGGQDGVGAQARFTNAASICFGEPGELFVADSANHRICRLTFGGRR